MTRSSADLNEFLSHCATKAADLFLARELIPEPLSREVSRDPNKVRDVTSCLMIRMKTSPKKFVDVVQVLLEITSSEGIVEVLKKNYGKLFVVY